MLLDKFNLDNLLRNRYLVIISGELTNNDRRTVLKVLKLYNKKHYYVGESHIEAFFCQELSKGVRSIHSVEQDTSIMFFKSGFLEHNIQGKRDLLRNEDDLFGILIEKLGIILD